VIDHLLATPDVTGPIKLTQPSVFYQFADPSLEERSAGQKLMIRSGPRTRRSSNRNCARCAGSRQAARAGQAAVRGSRPNGNACGEVSSMTKIALALRESRCDRREGAVHASNLVQSAAQRGVRAARRSAAAPRHPAPKANSAGKRPQGAIVFVAVPTQRHAGPPFGLPSRTERSAPPGSAPASGYAGRQSPSRQCRWRVRCLAPASAPALTGRVCVSKVKQSMDVTAALLRDPDYRDANAG
jgi:hypothetical protein